MKRTYTTHENPTREELDSIQIGDLIKCNDWKRPLRVVGVSENYFVMVQNHFGDYCYSVCDKNPSDYSRNSREKGFPTIGPDAWIFGYFDGYDWKDQNFIKKYLGEWETGKTRFSRRAVRLRRIAIKAGSVKNVKSRGQEVPS